MISQAATQAHGLPPAAQRTLHTLFQYGEWRWVAATWAMCKPFVPCLFPIHIQNKYEKYASKCGAEPCCTHVASDRAYFSTTSTNVSRGCDTASTDGTNNNQGSASRACLSRTSRKISEYCKAEDARYCFASQAQEDSEAISLTHFDPSQEPL